MTRLLKRFLPFLLLAATTASLFGLPQAQDEIGTPSENDRQAAMLVKMWMESQHLLARSIDDEISNRAMDQFLDSLDPMKTYFLKSDIAEFEQYRNKLDDALKSRDYKPAMKMFGRFIERIDQCRDISLNWLRQEHDFTLDEELVNEPDLVDYPSDENELSERWRKRVKYNLLVAMAEDIAFEKAAADKAKKRAEALANGEIVEPEKPAPPRKTAADRLKLRYEANARRWHQIDAEDVVEMFISAITTSFDPHTTYMSRKNYENFMIILGLELEGIGATLQADDEGYTVIKRIVPNGPADQQGDLKVEDRIAAVGQGTDGELIDVMGWALDDVVSKIRGEAGTIVRLSVMDEVGADIREISITRGKVELEDEAARGQIFEVGKPEGGATMKIGVIVLPSFYASMSDQKGGRSTTADVAKILRDFNAQDVQALVLDLRMNGGGSLPEAIDCTGLFVDSGCVVQVKDSTGQIEQLDDTARGMVWDKPMVVMTSKLSASASEILAGAIQDYGRGLVIGDTTTHGKGTVQSMVDFNRAVYRSDNPPIHFGALKISTAQFYRPNGDSTQLRGVPADIVLPSITDKMDVAESDLDYAVDFDKIPAANIPNLGLNSEGLVQMLREGSKARVAASEKFAKEQRKIDLYVEFKDRTALTLNKEKFFEQRKEFDAEEEDRNQLEERLNADKKDIEKTYYLEEVLNITRDYVEMLGKG